MKPTLPTCDSCGARVHPDRLAWTHVVEGHGKPMRVCKDRDGCVKRAEVVAQAMLRRPS